MEPKKYQKRVIADLSRYLELLRTTGSFVTAYRTFWREKGVPLGPDSLPDYQNLLPGVSQSLFQGAHWRWQNLSGLQRRSACL